MIHKLLKVHPQDNVVVALTDLEAGETITYEEEQYQLKSAVPAKHKFATVDLPTGSEVTMYGVLVGKTVTDVAAGSLLTTANLKHAALDFHTRERKTNWVKPDVSRWENKTFEGYHRSDGSVGTANYWLVVPMVFCENRNLEVLQEALVNNLGYGRNKNYRSQAMQLIELYKTGKSVEDILQADLQKETSQQVEQRLFPHIDGVKFLTHAGGCGGTRDDAQALCALLAGYITHPNVAGATVLSLGCQHAQVAMLQEEIHKRSPQFNKPLYVLEQQAIGTEKDMLSEALKQTFAGLVQANTCQRAPAPLSKLCIGLECGGSDGFSGISANPAIGYTSDLLVALGGSVVLAEFPELCGVEQNLSDRCLNREDAERFS